MISSSAFRSLCTASLLVVGLLSAPDAAVAGPSCSALFTALEPALRPELGEINYRVYGEGHAKTIVLVHGMAGDMGTYNDVAPDLAREFRVVTYDLRGHGGSAVRGADYSTHTMAGDLLALMDHLKIEKAFIAGLSMGGRVAARFTAQHPERVVRLLIEDMDLIQRTSRHPEKMRRALLKAAEVRRRLSEPIYSRRQYIRLMSPFFNKNDLAEVRKNLDVDEEGRWAVSRFPPEVALRFWNQGNVDNLLPDLAASGVPTLMLKADNEKFWGAMTPKGIADVHALMPGTRVVTIPDAEHSIHTTQYFPYMHHLREFFRAAK